MTRHVDPGVVVVVAKHRLPWLTCTPWHLQAEERARQLEEQLRVLAAANGHLGPQQPHASSSHPSLNGVGSTPGRKRGRSQDVAPAAVAVEQADQFEAALQQHNQQCSQQQQQQQQQRGVADASAGDAEAQDVPMEDAAVVEPPVPGLQQVC